jgi:enoyl-CoA hydratase
MAFETLIVETNDHVSVIRLNRPDALNALNVQLMSELAKALSAAQANEKVRCIVLTGIGEGLRRRSRHKGNVREKLC